VAGDILAERRSFAETLADVGPTSPTLAGAWTAGDLAAHVVSLDRLGGLPTYTGRRVVAGGIRLNDLAARFADASLDSSRRRGFEWALNQLRSSPPWLLLRRSVAPIGLFEVFVHHEDVRRAVANYSGRPAPTGLTTAVPWLLRYHRRVLPKVRLVVRAGELEFSTGAGPLVILQGALGDVVLWLAGRRDAVDVELSGDHYALKELCSSALRI